MNYRSENVVQNFPFSNPITKIAIFAGVAYVGFMAVNYAKKNDAKPQSRRQRQGFTSSHIDHKIDARNRAFGKPIPANPMVPFYSRHNYNRRRRSKNFW